MNKDNTPYDDVFRTMASRCSTLLLPLLNEAFGTHYTGGRQENVAGEVNHTMRGPIIMTESSRIFDSGVLVGEERGKKIGELIGEQRGEQRGVRRGICNSMDIAISMGANTSEAIRRVAGQYKMDTEEVQEIWENQPE